MDDRHPTPEQLYAARRGPRRAEAERHLAHAGGCAQCSAELARQEAFDHPEPVPQAGLDAAWERFNRPDAAAVPRQPAPSRGAALALAATLAACLLGFVLLQPTRTAGPPAADSERTRGSGEVAGLWSPMGRLEEPPAELVFPAPDGEPRRVTVYDAAGAYRWTSEPATGGRIAFPAAERQRLRPGVEYFWTILDGDEMAARSFEVRPPGH